MEPISCESWFHKVNICNYILLDTSSRSKYLTLVVRCLDTTPLQFTLLQTLGILGYDKLVDNILNVAIHKG